MGLDLLAESLERRHVDGARPGAYVTPGAERLGESPGGRDLARHRPPDLSRPPKNTARATSTPLATGPVGFTVTVRTPRTQPQMPRPRSRSRRHWPSQSQDAKHRIVALVPHSAVSVEDWLEMSAAFNAWGTPADQQAHTLWRHLEEVARKEITVLPAGRTSSSRNESIRTFALELQVLLQNVLRRDPDSIAEPDQFVEGLVVMCLFGRFSGSLSDVVTVTSRTPFRLCDGKPWSWLSLTEWSRVHTIVGACHREHVELGEVRRGQNQELLRRTGQLERAHDGFDQYRPAMDPRQAGGGGFRCRNGGGSSGSRPWPQHGFAADGRPICSTCQEVEHISRGCPAAQGGPPGRGPSPQTNATFVDGTALALPPSRRGLRRSIEGNGHMHSAVKLADSTKRGTRAALTYLPGAYVHRSRRDLARRPGEGASMRANEGSQFEGMVSKTSDTVCDDDGDDSRNSSRFLHQVEKDGERQEKEQQPGEESDTASVGADTLICGPRFPTLKDVDVFNLRASAGMGAFLYQQHPTTVLDNGTEEPVWVKRDSSKHDQLENSHVCNKTHHQDTHQKSNNRQDRSGNTTVQVRRVEREQGHNQTTERDRRRSESTAKDTGSGGPEDTQAAAPDGGWGWMIVLSGFIVEICLGGFARAVGVFFVEFVDAFGVGSADISWSISIMCGITFCGGLVSSVLCRRFGARPLVMIGGVVGAAGLFLTSFSTTILHLNLSLGLTTGLGFALVYNPTFIIIGQYFHQKRHLAYAMMVTGTGVGGFIFSPVFQLLIDQYGWRGAIIVQAGVTLHLCVAAALMRPLQASPVVHRPSQAYISQGSLSTVSQHADSDHPNNTTPTIYVAAPLERDETEDKVSQKTSEEIEEETPQDQQDSVAPGSPVPHGRRARQRGVSECSIGAVSLRLLESASSQESLPCIPEMTDEDASQKRLESVSVHVLRTARSHMSLSRRVLYSSQRMLDVLSRSETLLSLSSQLTYETTIHSTLAGKPGLSIRSVVATIFDPSLIKSVSFVLLSISFFLFHLGYLVPGIGVVPRAQRAGIEETRVSFLPSIISISDLVGRLFSGGLSKVPGCTRTFQFITLNVVIAVGAVVFPVTQTYSGMAAYAVWHGLANGLCYPLIPTLVVDVAGVERIASAMGLVMFITSIGLTLGLPTAGILYDTTGSYDASFYFVGACFLMSAAVMAFSHILSIRRQDGVPEGS
ncbi:hypothetical protein Bbelb_262240 [Branchiostoma belcheri]|nr:hypothetical protein Bbelb_262240 [Branchiostoma belcheri]